MAAYQKSTGAGEREPVNPKEVGCLGIFHSAHFLSYSGALGTTGPSSVLPWLSLGLLSFSKVVLGWCFNIVAHGGGEELQIQLCQKQRNSGGAEKDWKLCGWMKAGVDK